MKEILCRGALYWALSLGRRLIGAPNLGAALGKVALLAALPSGQEALCLRPFGLLCPVELSWQCGFCPRATRATRTTYDEEELRALAARQNQTDPVQHYQALEQRGA